VSPVGTPSTRQTAVPLRHRPSVTEMTAVELSQLVAAFRKLQGIDGDRGYQHLAGLHGLPLPFYGEQTYGQPMFLPWNRAYLYHFELALRATGHEAMLPWWDWITIRRIPAPYQGISGRNNPLHSVEINKLALEQGRDGESREGHVGGVGLAHIAHTVREHGRSGTRLPTASEIEGVTAYADFTSFTSKLEDYNGNVHVWVGGHMGDTRFATYDPLFWAHRCMIDRLWRVWQLRHPQASFPMHLADQVMEPFNLTAKDVLDPTALGYDYVSSSRTLKVKG